MDAIGSSQSASAGHALAAGVAAGYAERTEEAQKPGAERESNLVSDLPKYMETLGDGGMSAEMLGSGKGVDLTEDKTTNQQDKIMAARAERESGALTSESNLEASAQAMLEGLF